MNQILKQIRENDLPYFYMRRLIMNFKYNQEELHEIAKCVINYVNKIRYNPKDCCCTNFSGITNLQLIKILYLLDIDYLDTYGIDLFPRWLVDTSSWEILGPYIPIIYNEYCLRTAHPIYNVDFDESVFKDLDKDFIYNRVKEYAFLSLEQLIEETKVWRLDEFTEKK